MDRAWWRRAKPRTAAEIMKQAEIDVRRSKEQPVAYHRDMARVWKKHMRQWQLLVVTLAAIAVVINSRGTTIFYIGMAFWIGQQYRYSRNRHMASLTEAWQAENQETVTAMAEGGLLRNPREMLVLLRDADPPPGMKRQDWVASHDEMIKRWDEEHGA